MKLTSSPRLNSLLFEMGIHSYFDVLNYLPRRYESFVLTNGDKLLHLQDKERVVLFGTVIGEKRTLRFSRLSSTKFYFRDCYGNDHLVVAWNRPYLDKVLSEGVEFTLSASYDKKSHCLNMLNIRKGRVDQNNAISPIYSLPKDYPEHSFRQLVNKALSETNGKIYDHIPSLLRKKYKLIARADAYRKMHFPANLEDIHQAERVLKFEEALLFSLKNQLIRKRAKSLEKRFCNPINREKMDVFLSRLPFPLTDDQKKAIEDGIKDLEDPSPMYRLLQGDVGTGKTLVAASLLYANHLRSQQGAFLAPTDALAKQHYESLRELFKPLRINVTLLLGGMDNEAKYAAISDIEDGTADIIVGTHAIFSKRVQYASLGLAIIDEQHKFGVNQRAALASKGKSPDVLLMSATPIPRTLSLTLFGDLDVTTLTSFPAGKRDVETRIVKPDNQIIDKAINRSLEIGGRVYVVAPMIEKGEKELSSVKNIYASLDAKYPGKVALLHGKLSEEEKLAALSLFKTGICPIIVSTSIIEVGINVKEANLMIVYEPTSFSLSSLHQLRGRIGRDGRKALCLLAYQGQDEDDADKLNILVRSDDGFYIAEEDLRRRGPGEVSGIKQSGMPTFAIANIVSDIKMFEAARDDAVYLLEHEDTPGAAYLIDLAKKENEGLSLV